MAPDFDIVPLAGLGDPRTLEPLVRRVFGDGDRPRGWFARKLRRECVDPALSLVAHQRGTPGARLGYVLVGRPPSRHPTARTAGTGVVPDARGRGIATALLTAAVRRSRDAGLVGLELHADRRAAAFYPRHGFVARHSTVTALRFGDGDGPPPGARLDDRPSTPSPGQIRWVHWSIEAWGGTPAEHRFVVHIAGAAGAVTAWLSREGRAWLVQSMVAPANVPLSVAANAIAHRIPSGDPLLLAARPDDDATATLFDAGWTAAQRGVLFERRLHDPDETAAAVSPG